MNREQLQKNLREMRGKLQVIEQCSLELQALQSKYENLLESAPDAMLFVDRKAKIVFSNAQVEKLFGYTEEELVGRDLQVLIPERFRLRHKNNLSQYFANPHIRTMGSGLDIYGLRKDGSEFQADISLSPLEVDGELMAISSIRDITELKQAELKIERNYRIQTAISSVLKFSLEPISLEEQMNRILDLILTIPGQASQTQGAIYTIDNPGVLVLKARRELDDRSFFSEEISSGQCLAGKDTAICSRDFKECLSLRGRENPIGPPEFPLTPYCLPIVLSGHTLGLIVVFLETEHKKSAEEEKFLSAVADTLAAVMMRHQTEKEKNQLKADLAEAEKTAALGRITASVADKIRNPLTAIGGFARRLDKKISQGSKEKEYTEFILSEAGRLENILRNVLSLSRGTSLRLEKADLKEILREALRMFEEPCKERAIRIERSFEDAPVIEGEKEQILEAIENIIVNAMDAMPFGGRLTVATGTEIINGTVYGTVQVRDTGQGIKEEDLNRIFEPFFTTKVSAKRIGLGLSIAKKIVEDHHGWIRVESNAGTGAKFVLCFPPAAS